MKGTGRWKEEERQGIGQGGSKEPEERGKPPALAIEVERTVG
jgi:hypothetical protein